MSLARACGQWFRGEATLVSFRTSDYQLKNLGRGGDESLQWCWSTEL